MIPLLVARILKEGGVDLGDIIDMSIKEFEGKRVDANAQVTIFNDFTENTIVTATAAAGKDMYLGAGQIILDIPLNTLNYTSTVKLYINGVVKEEEIFQVNASQLESVVIWDFTSKGTKVGPGEIIKITAQQSSATNMFINYSGNMLLFQEDTGTTPAIS